MKAVFEKTYKSVNAQGVLTTKFRFQVKGTPAEIEQYKTDNPKAGEDPVTGAPIFTTIYPIVGCMKAGGVPMYKSSKGSYGLDSSEFDAMQAIANSIGATEQFNKEVVSQLTGKLFGARTASIVTAEDVAEVADEANLDNI
jgi:hypothetical protein